MITVDLVTGLLGAGKTTFVKGYVGFLKRSNINCAVIENEFGREGVDTAMLLDTGVRVAELAGGCICCGLKVDFLEALVELSKTYARVVVEPSGVFTIGDFYEVMFAPAVRECCQVGAVVTLVDGSACLSPDDQTLFEAQMCGTGMVVLNRNAAWGEGVTVPIIVDNGLSDDDFRRIMESTPNLSQSIKTDINHATIYQSCSFTPQQNVPLEQIEHIVRAMFLCDCGEVLRVKGSTGGAFINATPGSVAITPGGGVPMLNVIGRRLNRRAIRALLEATL